MKKLSFTIIFLIGLLFTQKAICQYAPIGTTGGAIFNTYAAGFVGGYLKLDNQNVLLKQRWRYSCQKYAEFGTNPSAINTLNFNQASCNPTVTMIRNSDSASKLYYFGVNGSGPNYFNEFQLADKGCNKCITNYLNVLVAFNAHNEYYPDSSLLCYPQSPGAFTIDSGVNAVTFFQGTYDIFGDSLSRYLKNVPPYGGGDGVNYLWDIANNYANQRGLYSSSIYRWQAYSNIHGPDMVNNAVILGIKNKTVSYNFGVVDKDNDSVVVRPYLLRLATKSFHPNYIGDLFPTLSTTATQNLIKSGLKDSTADLQYYNGYTPSHPFGMSSGYLLDSTLGQISFTPTDTGIYFLAYKMQEYRDGLLLGDVMTYRLAYIKDTNATLPIISKPFNLSSGALYDSVSNTITICPGQTLDYKVKATSTLLDAKILISSNAQQSAVGVTQTTYGQSTDSAVISFHWSPAPNDYGIHYIYVDAVDTACGPNHFPVHVSRGVKVHVIGQAAIIASKNPICLGDTVTLISVGGYNNSWSVVPGGDPYMTCYSCTESKVHPTHTTSYAIENKYPGCVQMFDTATIVVIQPFTATSHDTSFAGAIPSNYTLTVNVQPSAGYYQYNWMPFNKVTNYTIANPKPTGWTNHNVYYVTITDSLHCFTVVDTIKVNANTAGVTVVDNNASFKVYPNPTNGVLHINSAQSGILIIQDLVGKEVATYSIKEGMQEINLSSKLSAGQYLGHFIGKDQTQLVIKLEYEK